MVKKGSTLSPSSEEQDQDDVLSVQSTEDTQKVDEFKPPTPKFGGLSKIDTNKWAAWTGGKPNSAWTGLEKPDPACIGAKQYRPTSISAKSKAHYYRIEGLKPRFSWYTLISRVILEL